MTIWVVRYGNYEPAEVLGVYDNEDAARAHVAFGDGHFSEGMLQVERWSVQSEFRTEEDGRVA